MSRRPTDAVTPQPGQESVWDYPRPPRLEPVAKRIVVMIDGEALVDTTDAYRVLETSHPPVYYFPPCNIDTARLIRSPGGSFCEWKGRAEYWSYQTPQRQIEQIGWSYPTPTDAFEPIRDHIAFYAGRVDEATVDGHSVQPQPGGFYGGWITPDIVGPFKGGPGTMGW